MKAPSVRPVRCAIYTRVSTEHGLDQEFNSLDAQAQGPEVRWLKSRNSGCSAVQPCAQPWPPGTEILDAETKRQKSSFKRANARRDQNPGTEWPEILHPSKLYLLRTNPQTSANGLKEKPVGWTA